MQNNRLDSLMEDEMDNERNGEEGEDEGKCDCTDTIPPSNPVFGSSINDGVSIQLQAEDDNVPMQDDTDDGSGSGDSIGKLPPFSPISGALHGDVLDISGAMEVQGLSISDPSVSSQTDERPSGPETRSKTGSLPEPLIDIPLLAASNEDTTFSPLQLKVTRQVIDLTLDLENELPPEKVRLENTFPSKLACDQLVPLHNGKEEVCFLPKFHFRADMKRFQSIVKSVRKSAYVSNEPLFLADPPRSVIKVVSQSQFESMQTEQIQDLFRFQNIVVQESHPRIGAFDREALLDLARDDQQLSVNDLSIEGEDGDLSCRLRSATIDDILLHAQNDGKSLNALDIPMEDSVRPPSSLSSDIWAWKHTLGLKLCKRTDRFPSAAMRWALVSTSGAHSPWHIDCDRLCTMVRVYSGSKWWVLARPKASNVESFSHVDMFLNGFDVEAINDDRWDLEAILLTPGSTLYMRPNTPHCVFTLQSSICHGAHFYSTSTIRSLCYGLMHSFFAGNLISNTKHESKSRELLRRLVAYYHSVYMNPNYPESMTPHAINLESIDGLADFLTLANVMELSNVLYSKTYGEGISVREHLDFIEGRRLCSAVLLRYDQRMSITPLSHRLTITDTRNIFLRGQLLALLEYQRRIDTEHNVDVDKLKPDGLALTAKRFNQELRATFDNADELTSTNLGNSELMAHFKLSFGWPSTLVHGIVQRPFGSPIIEVALPPFDGRTCADKQYELMFEAVTAYPKTKQEVEAMNTQPAEVVPISKGAYRKIRGPELQNQPIEGNHTMSPLPRTPRPRKKLRPAL